MGKLTDNVRKTLKSGDTEGAFELYVTRTPGYLWALAFRALHIHPIAVTLMSIAIGAASGWCFYHTGIRYTLIGIFLLVWANWYDCADGQLARMTGKKTLIGRILDGFAGDVWFFSIYFFICLRLTPEWNVWIWVLGAWAGLHCHANQCAIADYYRNIHLSFFFGRQKAELDDSKLLYARYREMRWRSKDWFCKLYLLFYARYTEKQEKQTPEFQKLKNALVEKFRDGIPPKQLRDRFCQDSRQLMPATNILTFDTRAAVLFACLLSGLPWIYYVFESTVLEWLRLSTIKRHENVCRKCCQEISTL